MRPRHLCSIHGEYGCPYNECYASNPPGPFHCPKCFAKNLSPTQPPAEVSEPADKRPAIYAGSDSEKTQPTEQATLFD